MSDTSYNETMLFFGLWLFRLICIFMFTRAVFDYFYEKAGRDERK